MCGSMVDIQSVTAENRRGKKKKKIEEDRKKKPQDKKYNGQRATIIKRDF